ncbi:MAG: copper(I)-binding protein, partial [Alphaproteobacteria bacterium]
DNGIMRMRQVKGVDVPAGGKFVFKPGGHHIMFIGLYKPLKKGERFPVTLMFEKAGKQTVEVTVMGVGAMKGGMKHDMKPKHNGH